MRRMIAIVGATCSGKTTLARRLVEKGCAQVVSTTTRAARPGERHGQDYWFVDEETFQAMAVAGGLVEAAEFGGHSYGISRDDLIAAFVESDSVAAVVTPEGRTALEDWCLEHGIGFVAVFVSERARVLRRRLREERPDGTARERDLHEQIRTWGTRAWYDRIIPGRRADQAADELVEDLDGLGVLAA